MSLKNPSHCGFVKNLSESNLLFRFGSNSITSLALAMALQISCLFYIKLFINNKPATYKQGLQINDTMLKMFLAWFHVPVTATEWLWKRYGICNALSTSVTMTNRGHNFFYDIVAWSIRHHNHQLQWHHRDHQYNKVWTELCQQPMSKLWNLLMTSRYKTTLDCRTKIT